jgi:hypothetical protein
MLASTHQIILDRFSPSRQFPIKLLYTLLQGYIRPPIYVLSHLYKISNILLNLNMNLIPLSKLVLAMMKYPLYSYAQGQCHIPILCNIQSMFP